MTNNSNIFLKYIIVCALAISVNACTKTDSISQSDKDWLSRHPDLVVGISPNAPPYEFVNEKGELSGIFIDFLDLIESRIGYKFKREYQSDFPKMLNDTRSGAIDVLIEIQRTDEREQYLNFTPPLMSHDHVIVVRKSLQGISTVDDLNGKNVAVVSQYAVQEFLKTNHPLIKLIPLADDVSCLRYVSTGITDAFVCQQAVATYYIENEGISNLKIVGEIKYKNELAIATRKELDTLNLILTKAVNLISKNEKLAIYNNWLYNEVKPFYLEPEFWLVGIVVILSVLVFVVMFNIALRKRVKQKTHELEIAKEKAEESEIKFRDILDNIKIHLWAFNGKVYTFCNHNWYEYTGQLADTPLTIDFWLNCLHPDDVEAYDLVWMKNWATKNEHDNYFRLKRHDGVYRHFYNHSAPIFNKDGSFKHFLGYNIDITEKVEAEKKLQVQNLEYAFLNQEYVKQNMDLRLAKEQAEESDRLKSAFLANMSHEIRTPMNGILGFAGLLKEPGLTGEDQLDYIRIIEKSGLRMLNIINDIVDISKIEAGQMKVSVSATNINEQIKYVHTFFKPEAEAKGIKLSFACHLPAAGATMVTDREKLFAILTNLVKNAIKYSDTGSIELGYIMPPAASHSDLDAVGTSIPRATATLNPQFYVRDTGIGIPPDRQQAIFDRFVQADISDKKALQGAGLGLSITKAYVEMLGGEIWVESEDGKGSVFYFTIKCDASPVQNADMDDSVDIEVKNILPKKLKIVIAEDDEISEMLVSRALRNFSDQLIRVGTGMAAVEACRNNPDTDLVIMDIKMPGMDGYEATRLIRQFNPGVVIIAQTAYGHAGDREKSIAAGCDEYISKPIHMAALRQLILNLFSEK